MSEAFDKVKKRCEAAGLIIGEQDADPRDDVPAALLMLEFPRGRTTDEVWIQDGFPVQRLLDEPFERYRLIEDLEGHWSPEEKVIECALINIISPPSFYPASREVESVLERLGQKHDRKIGLDPRRRVEFDSDLDISISIGPCSNTHGILHHFEFGAAEFENVDAYRPPTLRIEGIEVATHDEAVDKLRRVADSLLFQLDLVLELPLALKRHLYGKDPWIRSRSKTAESLPTVRFDYDPKPMSLYWYGKSAAEMPLLQFLAYYQVLEFFFPAYSDVEAQRTLRNTLRNPAFDYMRDADVAKLLGELKVGAGGRGHRKESEQLDATIRHCVNADELRDFLFLDKDRYKYYTSDKGKNIVRERLPLKEKSNDHREAVAKRIYDIRNRIVHTKGSDEYEKPLFPFDPATKYLLHEIDLVEFLARKALIASNRPLHL